MGNICSKTETDDYDGPSQHTNNGVQSGTESDVFINEDICPSEPDVFIVENKRLLVSEFRRELSYITRHIKEVHIECITSVGATIEECLILLFNAIRSAGAHVKELRIVKFGITESHLHLFVTWIPLLGVQNLVLSDLNIDYKSYASRRAFAQLRQMQRYYFSELCIVDHGPTSDEIDPRLLFLDEEYSREKVRLLATTYLRYFLGKMPLCVDVAEIIIGHYFSGDDDTTRHPILYFFPRIYSDGRCALDPLTDDRLRAYITAQEKLVIEGDQHE